MSILKIERFFAQEVMLQHILCFYSPTEVVKKIGLTYSNVRRELAEMEGKGILVRHPYKCAYRLSRAYFNEHYALKTPFVKNSEVHNGVTN